MYRHSDDGCVTLLMGIAGVIFIIYLLLQPYNWMINAQKDNIKEYEKQMIIKKGTKVEYNVKMYPTVKRNGGIGSDFSYSFSVNGGKWNYYNKNNLRETFRTTGVSVGSTMRIESRVVEEDSGISDIGTEHYDKRITKEDLGGFSFTQDVKVYEDGGNSYSKGASADFSIRYTFEPAFEVENYGKLKVLFGMNGEGGSGWMSFLAVVYTVILASAGYWLLNEAKK